MDDLSTGARKKYFVYEKRWMKFAVLQSAAKLIPRTSHNVCSYAYQ